MDATHPRPNPVLAYGGIKHGEDRHIPSNTGRRRVNINGGINLERLEPIMRFDDSINADYHHHPVQTDRGAQPRGRNNPRHL